MYRQHDHDASIIANSELLLKSLPWLMWISLPMLQAIALNNRYLRKNNDYIFIISDQITII